MPAIYDEATLRLVWEKINDNGWTLRKTALELDTTTDVVNRIYEAARKRYAVKNVRPSKTPKKQEAPSLVSFERPKAVYSNHSPYRIVSSGLPGN